MLLSGFFSYQKEGYKFYLFGISHIIPIIMLVLLLLLLFLFRVRIRSWKYEQTFRYSLGVFIIFNQMVYTFDNIYITSQLYANNLMNQFPFPYASITKDLPLSLCGISMILTGFLLFTKNKKLFEVLYFWVLIGAILAILLPSAIANDTYGHFGPDKFRYYQFWLGHIGIVFIIFYMIFVWKYKISIYSLFRSYMWLIIFGAFTLIVNKLIDANYLFIMNPDETGLGFFPQYPYSIFIFLFLGLVFFFLIYLPWYYKRNNKL